MGEGTVRYGKVEELKRLIGGPHLRTGVKANETGKKIEGGLGDHQRNIGEKGKKIGMGGSGRVA